MAPRRRRKERSTRIVATFGRSLRRIGDRDGLEEEKSRFKDGKAGTGVVLLVGWTSGSGPTRSAAILCPIPQQSFRAAPGGVRTNHGYLGRGLQDRE
jgi:hypothetical protein